MKPITPISQIAGVIGACLLAATGAMLSYEVVARYFFSNPTRWAAELSQLCLIWGCLLSMAWVLRLRRHITVNAITKLLPLAWQKSCVALSLCVLIVFSMVCVVYGWEIFFESFSRGRTTGSLLNLPVWIAELSVPAGFALLTLQSLEELIQLRSNPIITLGSSHE